MADKRSPELPSVQDLGSMLSRYRFDEIGLALNAAGFDFPAGAVPPSWGRPDAIAGDARKAADADDPWKHASSARCQHCSPVEIGVSDEVTQWCFEVENPKTTAGDDLANFGRVDIIVDGKTFTEVREPGARKIIKVKGKSFSVHYQHSKNKVAWVRYKSC